MKIAIIVIVLALLLVIGNMSMLRVSATDQWLGKLRDAARKAGLNPRLVSQPEWVRSNQEKSSNQRAGMVARYSLVFVGSNFAPLQAKVVQGKLRVSQGDRTLHDSICPIEGAKAIEMIGEVVAIFWEEKKQPTHPTEPELICTLLKNYLQQLVQQR